MAERNGAVRFQEYTYSRGLGRANHEEDLVYQHCRPDEPSRRRIKVNPVYEMPEMDRYIRCDELLQYKIAEYMLLYPDEGHGDQPGTSQPCDLDKAGAKIENHVIINDEQYIVFKRNGAYKPRQWSSDKYCRMSQRVDMVAMPLEIPKMEQHSLKSLAKERVYKLCENKKKNDWFKNTPQANINAEKGERAAFGKCHLRRWRISEYTRYHREALVTYLNHSDSYSANTSKQTNKASYSAPRNESLIAKTDIDAITVGNLTRATDIKVLIALVESWLSFKQHYQTSGNRGGHESCSKPDIREIMEKEKELTPSDAYAHICGNNSTSTGADLICETDLSSSTASDAKFLLQNENGHDRAFFSPIDSENEHDREFSSPTFTEEGYETEYASPCDTENEYDTEYGSPTDTEIRNNREFLSPIETMNGYDTKHSLLPEPENGFKTEIASSINTKKGNGTVFAASTNHIYRYGNASLSTATDFVYDIRSASATVTENPYNTKYYSSSDIEIGHASEYESTTDTENRYNSEYGSSTDTEKVYNMETDSPTISDIERGTERASATNSLNEYETERVSSTMAENGYCTMHGSNEGTDSKCEIDEELAQLPANENEVSIEMVSLTDSGNLHDTEGAKQGLIEKTDLTLPTNHESGCSGKPDSSTVIESGSHIEPASSFNTGTGAVKEHVSLSVTENGWRKELLARTHFVDGCSRKIVSAVENSELATSSNTEKIVLSSTILIGFNTNLSSPTDIKTEYNTELDSTITTENEYTCHLSSSDTENESDTKPVSSIGCENEFGTKFLKPFNNENEHTTELTLPTDAMYGWDQEPGAQTCFENGYFAEAASPNATENRLDLECPVINGTDNKRGAEYVYQFDTDGVCMYDSASITTPYDAQCVFPSITKNGYDTGPAIGTENEYDAELASQTTIEIVYIKELASTKDEMHGCYNAPAPSTDQEENDFGIKFALQANNESGSDTELSSLTTSENELSIDTDSLANIHSDCLNVPLATTENDGSTKPDTEVGCNTVLNSTKVTVPEFISDSSTEIKNDFNVTIASLNNNENWCGADFGSSSATEYDYDSEGATPTAKGYASETAPEHGHGTSLSVTGYRFENEYVKYECCFEPVSSTVSENSYDIEAVSPTATESENGASLTNTTKTGNDLENDSLIATENIYGENIVPSRAIASGSVTEPISQISDIGGGMYLVSSAIENAYRAPANSDYIYRTEHAENGLVSGFVKKNDFRYRSESRVLEYRHNRACASQYINRSGYNKKSATENEFGREFNSINTSGCDYGHEDASLASTEKSIHKTTALPTTIGIRCGTDLSSIATEIGCVTELTSPSSIEAEGGVYMVSSAIEYAYRTPDSSEYIYGKETASVKPVRNRAVTDFASPTKAVSKPVSVIVDIHLSGDQDDEFSQGMFGVYAAA